MEQKCPNCNGGGVIQEYDELDGYHVLECSRCDGSGVVNDNELKPCPFCGDKPQITTEKRLTSLEFNKGYPDNGRNLYIEKTMYLVECICCSLSKRYTTEQEAIEAWNRRVE